MAVLEIQANGDTRVTEEAIARARHSLRDPNMRVSTLPYLSQLALRRAGEMLKVGLEAQQVGSAGEYASPAVQGSIRGGPYPEPLSLALRA